MTVVRIRPGVASGRVDAPPSKSYTHRGLIAGYLAHRLYSVDRPLDSDDTRATARAVGRLGTRVDRSSESWTLRPEKPTAAAALGPPVTLYCGESGTTLRFLAAVGALSDRPVRLKGRGRLPERPLSGLLDALRALGVTCRSPEGPRHLPLEVRGPLHGGPVRLDASESSQFASALLLALPTAPGDSLLDLEGPIVSAPYIDATLAVLRYHKVRVTREGRRFRIPGGQTYRGSRFPVPGDASSASYLWAAAALTGGELRVDGVPADWPQADLAVLDLLTAAGADVHRSSTGATVRGGARRAFAVDLTDAPDLYPLAGVLAAATPGVSRLEGAGHVVHKESNRQEGTVLLARALGANTRFSNGSLIIAGRREPRPFTLRNLHDHRLVMSAAVGALAASGPSTLADGSSVRKSFPGFWTALERVAGREAVR